MITSEEKRSIRKALNDWFNKDILIFIKQIQKVQKEINDKINKLQYVIDGISLAFRHLNEDKDKEKSYTLHLDILDMIQCLKISNEESLENYLFRKSDLLNEACIFIKFRLNYDDKDLKKELLLPFKDIFEEACHLYEDLYTKAFNFVPANEKTWNETAKLLNEYLSSIEG